MAKAIKYKPDRKAFSVSAPARDDNGSTYFRIKFNYGDAIKSENNERRAEGFYEMWLITMYTTAEAIDPKTGETYEKKATKVLKFRSKGTDNTKTEGWIDLYNFSNFKALNDNKTRSLANFYPRGDAKTGGYGWAIQSVGIEHWAWNRKGDGPHITATRKINPARPPELSELELDDETGIVSCTIEPDEGNDYNDRYDTVHELVVYNSHTGSTTYPDNVSGKKGKPAQWTEDEREVTYNVSDQMALTYEEYVYITLTAYSRGFGGRSKDVRRELYVSWPGVPSIGKVTPSKKGSFTIQDKVTVPITLGKEVEHPTTGVRLEKLVNVDYDRAEDIPGNAPWEDTGIVDDGQCTALSSTVAELQPDPGKRTWVRLKAWNLHEGIFYRYSSPKRLEALERPAPSATDSIEIVSALAGDDGASAELTIVWDADDATGTEVSWSSDPNAWRSTNGPQLHTFTWDDGPKVVGSKTWAHSALLYVAGLSGGTEYRFRARRYLDGETTTYGGYCTEESVTPAVAPGEVTISAPAYIAEGSDLQLTWTYSGGGRQTYWEIDSGSLVVGSGDDAYGSHLVPWSWIRSHLNGQPSLPFSVQISTGGAPITSETVNVGVAERPVISLSNVPATLTAQPLTFSVLDGDGEACTDDISVTCRSLGAERPTPSGMEYQAEGDVAWSPVASVSETPGSYSAEGDFWDFGEYEITVRATNRDTGLTSEPVIATFAVDYAHKAPEPDDTVTVVPHDDTDSDGVRSIYAVVTLAAPEGAAQDDLMELWRKTPNGTYLIAEDMAQGAVVTDEWAPYGRGVDLAYVVACRTVDGCVAWTEYPYELPVSEMRVDFDGRYAELPYNAELSDSYDKDFEARTHLDGTTEGYWGPGIGHKASLSTDVLPIHDQATVRAVHELARHIGPCYVRTPDGCAYEADIQLQPISREVAGIAAVSFDAVEVALTDAYMARSPYENETPEEE